MKYITDEKVLYEKICSLCPKYIMTRDNVKVHFPDSTKVIRSVEYDPEDGGENGNKPSYWVYLHDEFTTESGCGCCTIHEDSLKEVKNQLKMVVYDR